MDPDQNKVKCAHEGCDCLFLPSEGYSSDDKLYCSHGCAEGAGCEHEHCSCGAED